MKAALHIAFCLAPVMATAQVDDFLGTWCPQGEGPLMHFEARGLGFGDHTICDWKVGPTFQGGGFEGVLTCRNVYVMGQNADGSFATVETEHRRGVVVLAELMRTDTFGGRYLQITVDGDVMPTEFGPCG